VINRAGDRGYEPSYGAADSRLEAATLSRVVDPEALVTVAISRLGVFYICWRSRFVTRGSDSVVDPEALAGESC
jgi:hypothetical protein